MAMQVLGYIRERNLGNKSMSMKTFRHTAAHDVESFCWVLAYTVLYGMLQRTKSDDVPQTVEADEETEHDLRLVDAHKAVNNLFHSAFGQTEVSKILMSRRRAEPFEWTTDGSYDAMVEKYLSPPLRSLCEALNDKFRDMQTAKDQTRRKGRKDVSTVWTDTDIENKDFSITHDFLIDLLKEVIKAEESGA